MIIQIFKLVYHFKAILIVAHFVVKMYIQIILVQILSFSFKRLGDNEYLDKCCLQRNKALQIIKKHLRMEKGNCFLICETVVST